MPPFNTIFKFIFGILLCVLSVEAVDTRCCSNGGVLVGSSKNCVLPGTTASQKTTSVKPSLDCGEQGSFILDPELYEDDKFQLINGNLEIRRVSQNESYLTQSGEFCVTDFVENTDEEIAKAARKVAIVCFGSLEEEGVNYTIPTYLSISLLISSIFLYITFGVYCLLPELRDIQGICMMNFVIALAVGYMLLGILQLSSHTYSHIACIIMGYFTYFWMLAAFFWLNVVCFNIWRQVKCRRSRFPIAENSLRFIFFIYAWACPLSLLLLVVQVDAFTEPLQGTLRPGFGDVKCWFGTRTSTWLYFFGPVACLLIANIIFFIATLLCLRKEQRLPPVPGLRSVKYRAWLYFKLFVIMGIFWIFEIISFQILLPLWQVTDVLNALQGVLVFIVVVCRTHVVRGLVKRFDGPECLRHCARSYDAEQDDETEQLAIDEDAVKGRTGQEDRAII